MLSEGLASSDYKIITMTALHPEARAWKLHLTVCRRPLWYCLLRGCLLHCAPLEPVPLRDSFL